MLQMLKAEFNFLLQVPDFVYPVLNTSCSQQFILHLHFTIKWLDDYEVWDFLMFCYKWLSAVYSGLNEPL